MAMVNFKKGLLANLPSTYAEGTFYVTTDERAIYLDVNDTTRVRLGDFQEFATLADLQGNANPSTTALYYVADLNVLAKWNGSKYIQINLDTGATSAEKTGDGNALAGVSYDPATRKLTFTTVALPTATDVDNKIDAKVGELKIGEETFATVKAYVDKKTDGIATDAALETLTQRVTSAENDIDTLQGDKTVAGSVDKKIDDAIAALDLANTYDPKGAADGKDAAIAAAKKAGDDAQADVDALEIKVGEIPTGATATTVIGYVDEAVDKAIDTIPAQTDYSVTVAESNPEGYAKAYTFKQCGADIVTVNIPKDMVVESGSVVTDLLVNLLAPILNSFLRTQPEDEIFINVGDLIEYVTSGSAAGDQIMVAVSEDHKVTATLSAGSVTLAQLHADVQAEIGKAHEHANAAELNKIADGDKTKWDTAAGKAHEHANADELAKIVTGDKAKWDAAESNAKTYADGLMTWGSF